MHQAIHRFGLILLAALALSITQGCASNQAYDNDLSNISTEEAAERGRQAWQAEDYERARVLLKKAGDAGNARAQYALGYMHYMGQGQQRDVKKALKWIRRAADQGDKRAIEALGRIANGLSAQPGRRETDESSSQPSQEDDATTRPAEPEGGGETSGATQ